MATIEYAELSSHLGDYKVIDVRNKDEIEESGRIPGSFNIPITEVENALDLDDETFMSTYGFTKPSTDTPIVTHCFKGGRALKAYNLLEENGFTNAKCYTGSFQDWQQNGGKIVKDMMN